MSNYDLIIYKLDIISNKLKQANNDLKEVEEGYKKCLKEILDADEKAHLLDSKLSAIQKIVENKIEGDKL